MSSQTRHRRELNVGPLQLLFDDGNLRYFRVGGVEVLRRIYVAVRDQEWGTIEPRVEDLKIESSGLGFSASFRSRHTRDEIDFEWLGNIAARSGGIGSSLDLTVVYEMAGRAISTFQTNRTGICVLHPLLHCAGLACQVEHADGRVEASSFPRLVSPHQPFMDVRALVHEPVAGVRVEVRFEGDVFETEDQRNWTDGSFKTYSRPLALLSPYTLSAGEQVKQAITVHITGSPPVEQPAPNRIRINDKVGVFPELATVDAKETRGSSPENFAQVNRNRPPTGFTGTLAYPISPQVHSTDDLSVIENLEGQGDTVRTARSFAPAAQIAVGPITLRRASADRPDPRELTPFGVAWTVGSIKQLAEAGADSLSYGQFDKAGGSAMADVLRALGAMAGADVLACESSNRLAFDALALRQKGRLRVWVACLKDQPVTLTVEGLPDGARTLTLRPYEVLTLDYAGKERI